MACFYKQQANTWESERITAGTEIESRKGNKFRSHGAVGDDQLEPCISFCVLFPHMFFVRFYMFFASVQSFCAGDIPILLAFEERDFLRWCSIVPLLPLLSVLNPIPD